MKADAIIHLPSQIHCDAFPSDNVRFAIDLDDGDSASLFINNGMLQFRQFVTKEQLIALRDDLLALLPVGVTTSCDAIGGGTDRRENL